MSKQSSTSSAQTRSIPTIVTYSSSVSNSDMMKDNRTTQNNPSSNVVEFPYTHSGERYKKTEEKRIQIEKNSNNTVNRIDASYEDLVEYLQKAIDISETLNSVGNYVSKINPYEENHKLKEAEDKVEKIQKKFNLYRYYSLIWIISVLLLGVLTALTFIGFLNLFVSFSGILAVLVGVVGTYIDWKDREKRYDF